MTNNGIEKLTPKEILLTNFFHKFASLGSSPQNAWKNIFYVICKPEEEIL